MKLHLQIPDSLNDISLEDFQKFEKINVKGNHDTVFLMQKKVEIFCKVDLNLTLNIKFNDLVDIDNHINNILQSDVDLTTVFKMDDIEYGFIPNLSILDLLFNEGPNALNYLESQINILQ